MLRDDGRVTCEVLPALSFLDVAWARLGIDPVEAGVRLVDGHDFARAAAGHAGPLLIAHTHADWVLSDIKLAVEAAGDEPVTILQRLGTDDERITETTWSELDRTVDADHLTCVYVPHLGAPVGSGYVRFHELTRTLREQCPWDREQTHRTLTPYLVEEAFELVDALEALDPDDAGTDAAVIEELGDLLYHIEFHAAIAEQEGRFSIVDVTDGIHDKLVRRHPHVFAGVDVASSDEVLANWDQIKRAEKARTSVFDGVPTSQPALALAAQLGRRRRGPASTGPTRPGRWPRSPRSSTSSPWRASATTRPRSPTSSATCCSPSSTSPATSVSSPSWRCAPPPASSAGASKPSRRWPPSATSTSAPPTSPRSTRCGTR